MVLGSAGAPHTLPDRSAQKPGQTVEGHGPHAIAPDLDVIDPDPLMR
jgi:hypothetical protein